MKKYSTAGILIALFLLLTACNVNENSKTVQTETKFEESYHERTESYSANFDTMRKQGNGFTLNIATSIFSEDEAEDYFEKLESDFEKLEPQDENPNVDIYIVEITVTEKAQVEKNEVYLTKNEMENGDYKRCLVQAYYEIESLWQSVGLGEYLLGEGEIYKEKLQEYYNKEENMNTLTLFPAYFVEEFADEDTIWQAEQTATSLTSYVVENYGLKEFLQNGEKSSYRKEWLKSIEAEGEYPWTDDDMQDIREMTYSISRLNPLMITIDNWTMYFEKTDWLDTPEKVFLFVQDSMAGYHLLQEKIENCKIGEIKSVAQALEEKKEIHFKNTNEAVSVTTDNKIYLSHGYNIWHEMIHTIVKRTDKDSTWLCEGLAEYLSRSIQADSVYVGKEWRNDTYSYITTTEDWETEESMEYKQHVLEIYMENAAFPTNENEVDLMLFYEAMVKAKIEYSDLESKIPLADVPIAEYAGTSIDGISIATDGNALSYVEAYSFVKYLSQEYGEKKVAQVFVGELTFQEAFENDYAGEYIKWRKSL